MSKTIANVDIGGGTANVAVYRMGRLCGTCTLHIGGRLIEFSEDKISSISPPVRNLLRGWNSTLVKGDVLVEEEIKNITNYMADVISRMLTRTMTAEDKVLLLGHEPNWKEEIDVIMFSGGISECLYQYESKDFEQAPYHDIGMMLADSLRDSQSLKRWSWIKPDETVRATVLGAGTQTTEISGATIQVESKDLPVRNIPVYQISFKDGFQKSVHHLKDAVKDAIEIHDPQQEGQNFALYLSGLPYVGFRDIQQLAKGLLEAVKQKNKRDQPLIIVLESDHAKVLGQTLVAQDSSQSIICIDQIKVEHGDYLDIGQLLQTSVVPVVVKTLTFHS
jgi:ethanolamine utilization protein EutA